MIDKLRRFIYMSSIGVLGMIMCGCSYFFEYLNEDGIPENSFDGKTVDT